MYVFDVTNKSSFDNLKYWMQFVNEQNKDKKLPSTKCRTYL